MRAWWSQLFEPHSDTHFRSSIACSLLCLEEPTTYTASMAQPTEQCVHTERLTSMLPLLSAAASALPIMLNGNCEANAPAPAAMPERFRNARRSIVFASIPERLRDRRLEER